MGFFDRPFDEARAGERLQRGDLRNMQRAQCQACGIDWWAPVIGRCPRCRADGAVILERKEIGAPHV